MLLRRPREAVQGQPRENSFEAMDEYSGERLGSCTIVASEFRELFPQQPLRIFLDLEGKPIPDALLGAVVARAKEIAKNGAVSARIYTRLDPDDAETMQQLRLFGFRDNDGLVRMRKQLPCEETFRLPAGCVTVTDDLDDPIEQKYFLERWNLLYEESNDFAWLQNLRETEGFKRILIVSPTGMVAECVIWQEENTGVIGWIYTAKKWRGMNAAPKLLELACMEFARRSIFQVQAEIQARIPSIFKAMEKVGFQQDQLIWRYPGIDVDVSK